MSTGHGDLDMAQRHPQAAREARVVGELLSPPPILVILALVVAWDSSPTPAMAVLWGGIAAVFASVLPYAIILRGVRRGRLTDKNISLREERIRFGVVAITSILTGLAVLRRSTPQPR
jgi:hypothetical protein